MTPRVIGITANGIGAGKSTVAAMLVDQGFALVSFAEPIREMLAVLLQRLGHPENEVRPMLTLPSLKKRKIPGLDVTTRHMLRTLGTEWGRQQIHPSIWLMAWEAQARHHLRNGRSVVCDDVRFANEMALVRSLPNSELWHVEWEAAETSDHPSDNGLPDNYEPDVTIENNEGLEELHAKVVRALV